MDLHGAEDSAGCPRNFGDDVVLDAAEDVLHEQDPEMPRITDSSHRERSGDGGGVELSSGIDLPQIVLEHTENLVADEATSSAESATRREALLQQPPNSNSQKDDIISLSTARSSSSAFLVSEEKTGSEKWPVDRPLATGESIDEHIGSSKETDTDVSTPENPAPASSQPGCSPVSSASNDGGCSTDGERSSNGKEEASSDAEAGPVQVGAASNDLPTQLNRIWGASPPDRAEGLGVMRDMLGHREELDIIISRLMAAKVRSSLSGRGGVYPTELTLY